MTFAPRLIAVDVPDRPEGAVLVLHGGAGRREPRAVSPTQLSVVRMVPIARRAARVGGGRLAVFRLLNGQRGWGEDRSPVDDAHWALEQIADRLLGALPTCLIGHSLGARAALFSADRDEVRSVVALAPWVYPDDDPPVRPGQRVLVVHGVRDRIASLERAESVARTISARASVGFVRIAGGKHAMLAHHRDFDGLAARFAARTLLGEPADEVVARIESGEPLVEL